MSAGSRTFRRGVRASISTAESHGTRQLTNEPVALRLGLRDARVIRQRSCLFDVLVDFGEPAAVRLFSLRIEQRT
jgi:hypothetical protein